jgi:hypothetical protein
MTANGPLKLVTVRIKIPQAGNTICRGRLCTVDLLVEVAYFVTKVNDISLLMS